jgi:hypothetical protein
MNPSDLSTTLPARPSGFVARDNLTMTIDTMLDGDTDVVLVGGRDGVGKTTVLNGYVRSRAESSICLFLRPVRVSYEPSGVLPELYSQFNVALRGQPPRQPDATPTRSDLAQLLHRLASRLHTDDRRIVVVVDGLEEVWQQDRSAATEILGLLPVGRPRFRFVLSGELTELLRSFRCGWQDFPVTLFSLEETRQLFAELAVPVEAVARAHHACNGVVGQLAAVRRLCTSGLSIDYIIDKQPGDLENTMILEWERARALLATPPDVLPILTFDARRHSVSSLAAAASVSPQEVSDFLSTATFLQTTPSGHIEYVSETFRTFGQRRLAHLRQTTLERLITSLLADRSQPSAVSALPRLMADARQFDRLIALMDVDYFRALLATTQSVGDVMSLAALGADSAALDDEDTDVFRFRLLQSLTAELVRNTDSLSRIKALLAIGRIDDALVLTRASTFVEERLALLAASLAEFSSLGLQVDRPLLDELRQLCNSVPIVAVADDIVEIASDVFAVDPDTAIALIERLGVETKRPQMSDWVIASISVRDSLRRRRVLPSEAHGTNVMHEGIANPDIRSFVETVRFAGADNNAEWILDRAGRIKNPRARITLLRMWLDLNSDRTDAARAALATIDLIVKTPSYAPSATTLRQVAAALKSSSDTAVTAQLLSRVDALVSSLARPTPILDYARLQLLLAQTERALGKSDYKQRVLELYVSISANPDVRVRAACHASLYSQMRILEPDSHHDDLRSELLDVVKDLLRNSAQHEHALQPVLRSLVPHHLDLALTLVQGVNTDLRRDRLYAFLVEELADQIEDPADLESVVKDSVTAISHWKIRDHAIIHALAAARDRGLSAAPFALALWRHAPTFVLPEDQAAFLSYLLRLLAHTVEGIAIRASLHQTLEAILDPAERLRATYLAAREIGAVDRDTATRIFDTVQASPSRNTPSLTATNGLTLSARLATRALRPVFGSDRGFNEELTRILDVSAVIPDVVARVTVLQELCFALRSSGRTDIWERVHDDHLSMALQEAKSESLGRYWYCLSLAGWSLFHRHEKAFLQAIQSAPENEREEILRRTVRTISRGIAPTEPTEDEPDAVPSLTDKDVSDLLTLLAPTGDDALFFDTVRCICRSSSGRESGLNREQRTYYQREFAELVAQKLPSARKITHYGYRWACLAELNRLGDSTEVEWRELVDYAVDVPNVPDSAYTLALVAAAIPTKFDSVRRKAATAALDVARSVSVASERVGALVNVAREVWRWQPALAKEALKAATQTVKAADEKDFASEIDRLLHVAYRISPEFAEALGDELDSVPSGGDLRPHDLSQATRTLELRRAMTQDADSSLDEMVSDEGETLAAAAWRGLAALNAGTAPPVAPRALRRSLEAAARWPITVSYPTFAWAVQNWVERPTNSAQHSASLRRLAQMSLVSADLVRVLASGSKPQGSSTMEPVHEERSVTIVAPGERARAMDIIQDWCGRMSLTYLKIVDQYFGPAEMELIKLVCRVQPRCNVFVMTSRKHLRQLKIDDLQVADAFQEAWARITNSPIPSVDITVVSIPPMGKGPIHDRWWITEGGALDFGTSANSLGLTQISSVKECGAQEAAEMEHRADKYLSKITRWSDEGRIGYVTVSL